MPIFVFMNWEMTDYTTFVSFNVIYMPIVVSCELWMQVASNFAANIDFIGVYYSTSH